MKKKKQGIFAAIHVGSEMISLQIIEYSDLDKMKIVDEASKRVKLGEETFKHKRISFGMVTEICELLKGYKRLMDEYGVEEYSVQATTAVREAENQAYFLDQILVKTGLHVEVVEMPREIYTKYVSILRTLANAKEFVSGSGMLFVDISSGGLGITYMKDNEIKYQQNLHIGVIRIKEDFDRNQRSCNNFGRALTEYISSTVGPVREEMATKDVRYLVLSGTETELVLKMFGKNGQKKEIECMQAEDFMKFYDRVRNLSMTQLVKVFNLEQTTAELVLPTIILYQQLLSLAPAKEIIITPDRFIDGMKTLYVARKTNKEYIKGIQGVLLSLVDSIGTRYNYDRNHAVQVEKFALAIFDSLRKTHGMDDHCRLLLRAACILHDIGKYICLRSHSLYSYELIMSTDILGFSNKDKRIIALTAYYHSHLLFETQPAGSPQVERSIVPLVAKLAAILRLADAMDRSYKQKIKSCKVVIKGNEMIVTAKSKYDLTLEEWTFANKGNFFEEVYGLLPILEKVEG
ncbi:MAG: HD domain-containing protein [Acidaminococcaceae bacterium]|nr:HD domain-containing protein [Acidaminococcaceae bacterium]